MYRIKYLNTLIHKYSNTHLRVYGSRSGQDADAGCRRAPRVPVGLVRERGVRTAAGQCRGPSSGLSPLNGWWIPERGARIARRETREYREYVSVEQRREAGCPARKALSIQRGQATSLDFHGPPIA